MRACVLVCLALLASLPMAAADAGNVRGTLTLHDAPALIGTVDGATEHGGVDLVPAVERGSPFALSWGRASGKVTTAEWLTTPPPIPTATSSRRSDAPFSIGAARLTEIVCAPGCRALLFSEGVGLLTFKATANGALSRAAEDVIYWAEMDDGANGSFVRTFPEGSLRVGAGETGTDFQGTVSGSGRHRLLIRDALLRFESPDGRRSELDVRAGTEPLAGGVAAGPTRTWSRFAVLQLDGATFDARLADVLLLAPRGNLTIEGRLRVPAADGTLHVAGESRGLDGDRVELSGATWIEFSASDGAPTSTLIGESPRSTRFDLRADATEVWINGKRVHANAPRIEAGSLVALVAGGLLLAARLVIPLYSRISRDRLFANENRRRIWDLLSDRPGLSVSDISRSVGLARVVVRHHLSMLRAHGVVTSTRRARGAFYFPTGHEWGSGPRPALDSLGDPSRRRIAEEVARSPSRPTQLDIARATGLSARLVSYHLGRLESAGLVVSEGAWRRTYAAAPHLAATLTVASEIPRTENR